MHARVLLVEGVPGAGKSTLVDRMVRRHVAEADERRVRTLVHLTQAHTYGPLAGREDAGTLTAGDCLLHLERVVGWLEWLVASVDGERQAKCFILVDTLHLTHCLRPGLVGWEEVAPYDRRLAALGCRLVLLDAADATVAARTVAGRADSSFIRDYALGRFGRDLDELTRHFLVERDRFRALFGASAMAGLRLPAEEEVEPLAAAAFDFWRAPR